MNLIKTATNAVEKVVSKVNEAAPFGKFERFTAGFCMAIPFFLLIADMPPEKDNPYLLIFPLAITFLPLGIPELMRAIENRRNYGMAITIVGGLTLFGLYLLFSSGFGLESRISISDYVTMDNSYIFGMLLAIAAMLFIASGVVYWNKKNIFSEGGWRSLLNVVLGCLLILVIVFPVDRMYTMHMIFALGFFIGCAIGTVGREVKEGKRAQHRFFDFAPVALMALAMLAHFGQQWGWFPGGSFSFVNLFGAESIALWITGLDFILVSLKRELDPRLEPEDEVAKRVEQELRRARAI